MSLPSRHVQTRWMRFNDNALHCTKLAPGINAAMDEYNLEVFFQRLSVKQPHLRCLQHRYTTGKCILHE